MRTRTVLPSALLLAAFLAPAPMEAQVTVEAQIAAQIVDRMPQNAGGSFPVDVGSVACWTRVTGAAGSTLQHVWIHGDMEFPVTLEIGGSPWRTWSTKEIPPEWAGEWRVEVRDAAGSVLETLTFTVGS